MQDWAREIAQLDKSACSTSLTTLKPLNPYKSQIGQSSAPHTNAIDRHALNTNTRPEGKKGK